MDACKQACLMNAVAGAGDKEGKDGGICVPRDAVPGLVYPIPFSQAVGAVIGTAATVTLNPLNTRGAIPFALLISDDSATGAPPTVPVPQTTGRAGKPVGIRGGSTTSISTAWPLESFLESARASERLEAGLPNLPPDIGKIASDRPMTINLVNTAAGATTVSGVLFVVIPRD